MSALLKRLADPARAGVYRAQDAAAIIAALRHGRLDCVRLALPAGKEAMLERIAQAFAFPDWFGGNWDALEDCLGDLSWREGEGTVLLVEDFSAGDELGILIDILRSCAEAWAQRGRPFAAVFIDPRRRLKLPELAA